MRASLDEGYRFLAPEPFGARSYYDSEGRRGSFVHATREASAVRSYRFEREHPLRGPLERRAFTYDLAVALLAQLAADRSDDAATLGETLLRLARAGRGAPGFSVEINDPAYYDAGYVRAGAVAWAGYALARYDLDTGDRRFRRTARLIADALLAMRVDAPGDPRHGLVTAGRGRWVDDYRRFEGDFVADYCVTEHQLDLWFFLDALGRVEPRYRDDAEALGARIVDALWLPDEQRFAQAVSPRGLDRGRALDAAGAWGALFLHARGDLVRARAALAFTEANFATEVDGLPGFAPYAGVVPEYPGVDFSGTYFAEGTAAVALARLRLGDRAGAERLTAALRTLQRRGEGGVIYATPAQRDMPALPAVAPTAWLMLLERELAGGAPRVFAAISAR